MDTTNIKREIERLEREISILEWDRQRNQLNPGKEVYLKKIIERRDGLLSESNEEPSEISKDEVEIKTTWVISKKLTVIAGLINVIIATQNLKVQKRKISAASAKKWFMGKIRNVNKKIFIQTAISLPGDYLQVYS